MHAIKVSFDFDGTLKSSKKLQKVAKNLDRNLYDPHIVTARFDSIEKYTKEFLLQHNITNIERDFYEIFDVAKECNIEKIVFTNGKHKFLFFKENDFCWHIDDDPKEIQTIKNFTKTKCYDVHEAERVF